MITIYKPLTHQVAERRGQVILARLLTAALAGDLTSAQIAQSELAKVVTVCFLTGATIRRWE